MTSPSHNVKAVVKAIYTIVIISGLSMICSCSPKGKEDISAGIPGDATLSANNPMLKLLSAEKTGIDFQNTINETFELNITTHINTSNGGGVAILDVNRDGLQDIYFISTSGENKLYINQGGLKFKDETEKSGLSSVEGFEVAVTAADVNQDGYMDIFICRAGPVENEDRRKKLFINNHDLTFTERAKEYGLDDKSASMGANFFDYDRDGDLDLYLLNYPVDFGYSSRIHVKPNAQKTGVEPLLDPIGPYDTDRLYRNDGPPKADGSGGFKDVSKQAGIWNFGYGLSVSIEDFNQDGWMDVYVANDFIQPDLLYINNQDGTFTNQLNQYFDHTSQHTMGTDLSDFDNDGLFDLLAVDMLSFTQYRRKTVLSTNSQNKYNTLIRNGYFEPVVRNVLQHNNGNGTFSDIACMANVFQTDWSWSSLMADLDNDSYKDILITNGYQREVTDMDFINFTFADIKAKGNIQDQFKDVHDFLNLIPQYKLRDFVFQNKGDWTFQDQSGNWMTTPPTWSNGAAITDLDNDGDLDYVVNNINDYAFVYENQAAQQSKNHYLQFTFAGPVLNPFGIGTTIHLYNDNAQQYFMVSPTRGIFSSIEYLAHFGLGDHAIVDRVEIKWPDGKMQTLHDVPANQRIKLNYTDAGPAQASQATSKSPTFVDVTQKGNLKFVHSENDFIDFEKYFLLPWTLSDLGPLMSAADINGDGLTDVFIGNSFGKPAALFTQTATGKFSLISGPQWNTDSLYEDHGSLFFDVDVDGDLDLLVISGGYESVTAEAWKSRLYINDQGKQFIHAPNAIPLLPDVCMRAAAYDYDHDGDLDLFLGGRVKPGQYPITPDSYILRNDRNKFVEVAAEIGPAFKAVGMVTDLQFANFDADPELELVVVGEWMPVTLFDIQQGKLIALDAEKTGFALSNGFWNKVVTADVDQDGDMDLLTGNLGLNSQYKPTASTPVECFALDVDQNGSIDPILTYFEDTKRYPMVQKDVLIKQVPMLKKKFIYAKDYANATIEDILTPKQLSSAIEFKAYQVHSGWWENNNGKFTFHPFPNQAQASPINGILFADMDGDSNPDILLAGNKYRTEVETGRFDAGIGVFLKGVGKGQFEWVPNTINGFWAPYDVRDLALLTGPAKQALILVSNNNHSIQLYATRNNKVVIQ